MVDDKVIFNQIKTRLIQHFQPLKMYLFGSRADGTASAASDYDIVLVVCERHGTRIENMIQATRLVNDLKVSVDVFVYTESEFQEWKDEMNSIPETALTQGREITLG